MKHLSILTLWLCVALVAPAAQLTGALRINTDTTGTNTKSSAVTISSQVNLLAGSLTATNGAKWSGTITNYAASAINLQSPTGTGTTNLIVSCTNGMVYVETLGFTTTWITFTNISADSAFEQATTLRLTGNGSRSIQIRNSDFNFDTAIATNSLASGETEFTLRWTGTQKVLSQSPEPYLTGLTGNVQTQLTAKQGALLDGVNQTDTLAGAVARGYIIVGNSTPKWARLAQGSFGSVFRSDGTDIGWYVPSRFTGFFDDFLVGSTGGGDTVWQFAAGGGTYTEVAAEAGHPGIFGFSTSTSSSSTPNIFKGTTSYIFGGGTIILEAVLKIPTLSDGSERFTVRFGFAESVNSALVDGAMFEYRDNLTSGNWNPTTANNSASTTASGGASVAASTSWTRLTIVVNAAGTQVDFYVDGTLAGTSTTNIPTSAGRETGIRIGIVKSVGTTARTVTLDYIWLSQLLTNAR